MTQPVVMIGATGAVGGHGLSALLDMPDVTRITLLGQSMARNLLRASTVRVETLEWADFHALVKR